MLKDKYYPSHYARFDIFIRTLIAIKLSKHAGGET